MAGKNCGNFLFANILSSQSQLKFSLIRLSIKILCCHVLEKKSDSVMARTVVIVMPTFNDNMRQRQGMDYEIKGVKLFSPVKIGDTIY